MSFSVWTFIHALNIFISALFFAPNLNSLYHSCFGSWSVWLLDCRLFYFCCLSCFYCEVCKLLLRLTLMVVSWWIHSKWIRIWFWQDTNIEFKSYWFKWYIHYKFIISNGGIWLIILSIGNISYIMWIQILLSLILLVRLCSCTFWSNLSTTIQL